MNLPERTRIGHQLDIFLQAAEEYFFRLGYRRVFGGILGALALLEAAGGLFGQVVVNIIALTVAIVLLVFLGVAGVFGTRRLRQRERDLSILLGEYAKAIEHIDLGHGLVILHREDAIRVAADGDVEWIVTYTLGASSNAIPHYLLSGFVAGTLTSRAQQRAVRWAVSRLKPGGSGAGTGVQSAHIWTTNTEDAPMLKLSAYLGRKIASGEKVTFHVVWPGASAELRKGKESEEFYVAFRERVIPITYEVLLADAKGVNINSIDGTVFSREESGEDQIVRFASADPTLGSKVGVELSFQKVRAG